MKLNFSKFEKKWQKIWEKEGLHKTKDKVKGKKNHMLLVEFPYPSGNLHIGHWYAFAVPDILARFLKMSGKNEMYPIGFDAFGLPAENAAIKHKINPRDWTQQNISYMTKQLKSMGASFDWSRVVSTIDPQYYKWTQWIFLKLYGKDLAYRAKTLVNWCPGCKTVLANEQVINGKCERCGTEVVQKEFEQWMMRITDYADRLIDDLEGLDWPETTKVAQRNWIGRSEGAVVKFPIVVASEAKQSRSEVINSEIAVSLSASRNDKPVEVFTTRLDTIYGCTYMVVAPEHQLIENLKLKIENYDEVDKYIEKAKTKLERERLMEDKRKTGVELKGIKTINPFTNEEIPVFVADYVLGGYGTGAVMAVPAHDERDFEFAKKYNLPIREVVTPVFGSPNEKSEFRKTISAVIHRKKDDKFLLIKWKKFDWISPVIGGVEDGENIGEAAEREVFEETGYKTKFIKRLGEEIESHFFAANKNVWRSRLDQPVLLEIIKEKPQKISDSEKEKHGVIWLSFDEAIKKITHEYNDIGLLRYKGLEKPYTEDGRLSDSGKFTGMKSEEARKEMVKWLKENNFGEETKNYKLHDWVISRQRYWGVPIPVIKCEKCGYVPVSEKDLPVKLPALKDFLPTKEGKSPLAKAKNWVNVQCPKCKGKAERETDTMDTFVDSSWYFIRYADPKNNKKFADIKKMKNWLPIPMYIGGAEHNTMHLLYSRFFIKALYDLKHVYFNEPFIGRRNHGTILGPDGQKMSKSRGNVVDPDGEVAKFGADSVRMYLAFMGPYDQDAPWQLTGIVGVHRFLNRVYRFYKRVKIGKSKNEEIAKLAHRTIKKVEEDIQALKFNTAISGLMILFNELEKEPKTDRAILEQFLKILAPFAPHLSEELWQQLGILRNKRGLSQKFKSIHNEGWPKYNPKLIKEEKFDLIVQINGKFRDRITAQKGIDKDKAQELALKSDKIKNTISGAKPRKIIFVPNKLINFVL